MNFFIKYVVFVSLSFVECSLLNASGEADKVIECFSTDSFYEHFLNARLVYIFEGKQVEVRFRGLSDPLDGAFDMSVFGDDVAKRLRIYTGFKKENKNEDVSEVWICPFFFSRAPNFREINSEWRSPVGIFRTWGRDDIGVRNFDYEIGAKIYLNGEKSIGEMLDKGRCSRKTAEYLEYESIIKRFYIVIG
jgi:hypothetical protein